MFKLKSAEEMFNIRTQVVLKKEERRNDAIMKLFNNIDEYLNKNPPSEEDAAYYISPLKGFGTYIYNSIPDEIRKEFNSIQMILTKYFNQNTIDSKYEYVVDIYDSGNGYEIIRIYPCLNMKMHNKKDELLVQIGTSIPLRIISNEIEANKALDNKYYSTVAGFNNVNIGLKTSLTEIGKNFGNSTNPEKVRIGSYFEAVNDRMNWLKEQDNK